MIELHQQAISAWKKGNYAQAAILYEQAIEAEPQQLVFYWYLGLAQLLQGKEEEAQITWMMPILGASDEQSQQWSKQLLTFLDQEANSKEADGDYETAWLIRQHYQEIDPEDHKNLLQLLWLSIKLERFTEEDGLVSQLIQIYNHREIEEIQDSVLLQLVQGAFQLKHFPSSILELAEVAYSKLSDSEPLIKIFLLATNKFFYTHQYQLGETISKFCLRLAPNNLDALLQLSSFCRTLGVEKKWESIKFAEQYLNQSQDLANKLTATHIILSNLMEIGGHFHRASGVYQLYKALIVKLEELKNKTDFGFFPKLLTLSTFLFYFEDAPQTNRPLCNSLHKFGQAGIESLFTEEIGRYRLRHCERKKSGGSKTLKIGYLSAFLRRHSVGWLVRWLLKYHHSSKLEVHLYSINQNKDPLQQQFMAQYGDNFHYLAPEVVEITNQIYEDEIDILVDLDSISSWFTIAAMAAKPAPLQVTWLGCDASGLPAIDYFIADPYVLPDNAPDYYSEKIWRLPHTYIAVDGFEVAVPTLRREQLDIPEKGIIYFSSQTGYKRNPDNVRLQMRIVKAVNNSYFVVKGGLDTDSDSIASFFNCIAEEEGVNSDHLRFLPAVAYEAIHRANLTIADVVLDTYPYNGATTTLETLWMGIPLVTRVGEQFAARNSYTMMINAGVTEGIAWTDEEYVDWGVRLGQDEGLRQKITWKLHQSKHTSPLWNGEQFAREMENAYEQMWMRYIAVDSG